MNERIITVGTEIIVKVGRNEVEAVVTKTGPEGTTAKSKSSGKEFKVNKIVRIVAQPTIEAQPTTEASPAKKLSLLKAAAQVLKESGTAMNTKEILAKVQEQGLWSPKAGKTPENTLYAAILREINTKEAPVFKRSAARRGAFESAI